MIWVSLAYRWVADLTSPVFPSSTRRRCTTKLAAPNPS